MEINSIMTFRLYRNLVLALILPAAVLPALAETRSDKGEISRNLDIFNSLYKELQTQYVDSIDAAKSITTAIDAMLNDIDPYTEYYSADDQDDIRTISTGEYGGIGSYIMQRTDGVYISEPYKGSPAQLAGLRAGDRIIMIDNDSVTSLPQAKVSERLKGQAGTRLTVTVDRPFVEDSILTFELTRQKIQMPSVPYYGVVGDSRIGYISLTSFTDKAPQEVHDALIDLKENHHVNGVILDLQGNGGGLLESAVKIVGLFVPKNTEVLRTRGKGVLNEKVYKTTSSPVDTRIPLAVLIDGNSASSSEIVAGSASGSRPRAHSRHALVRQGARAVDTPAPLRRIAESDRGKILYPERTTDPGHRLLPPQPRWHGGPHSRQPHQCVPHSPRTRSARRRRHHSRREGRIPSGQPAYLQYRARFMGI